MQFVNISYGLLLRSFMELTDLSSSGKVDLPEIQPAQHRLIFLGCVRSVFSIMQDTNHILLAWVTQK